MQNESQNIEYKESWGRGFKKIAEEFERASLPLPTIEENGGGVMAIVQRKTIDEVIAERGGDVGVNGGDGGNVAVMKLTYRQQIILSFIAKHFDITAKQMAVMSGIPQRTIERELSILQKADMICHIGAPRTGRWKLLKQIDFDSK